MTDELFQEYILKGIDALPSWVKEELTNVAFIVSDEPNEAQVREHQLSEHETLFGLYEGVPLTERGNDSPALPDTITLFTNPIREAYSNEYDIEICVANTIWHEVAHYFGHDEEWVEAEEMRRGKVL